MEFKKSLCAVLISVSLVACGGGSKNSAPNFNEQNYSFTLNEDSVVQGLLSATDPDNDPISYAVTVTTTNGIFTLNPVAGSFTYTPNANFYGNDSATVQVSDGTHFKTTTISFIVNAQNDAPVYVSTSLESGEAGSILGVIQASDIENDPLSFTLEAQPVLGLVTLNADGSFIYTPNDLTLIDDNFVVLISDGVITTRATISLISQYNTNLDKLSYYYASDYSHLKKAENLAKAINDSATTDPIYQNISKAYYQAGFNERAKQFINDKMSQNESQAIALRNLADIERDKNNLALAKEFYTQAFELYNQLVAEKGYASITANDASFYQNLSRRLVDINEAELGRTVSNRLIDIADNIKAPLYSTAYGRILTAFGNYASSEVNNWLSNKTASNYANASYAVEKLGYLAQNTGYQVVSGQSVTNLKTLNLITTANLYFLLGDSTQSKTYTALAFADYNYFANETPTYRSLDAAFDKPQGIYAQNTVQRYPAGMSDLMAMVALNFGTKYTYVEELLTKYGSATQLNSANKNLHKYTAFNRIKNGENVASVLTSLKSSFASTYDYFSALLDYSGDNLAMLLKSAGLESQAVLVTQEALQVFSSQAYIDDVVQNYTNVALYTLSTRGCLGVINNFEIITGNINGVQAACSSHVELFKNTNNTLTTEQVLDGMRASVALFEKLELSIDKTALADVLSIESALISDRRTRMLQSAQSAAVLAKVSMFEEAESLSELIFDDLYQYVVAKEYGTSLTNLNLSIGYIVSYLGHEYSNAYANNDFPTVLVSLRSQAHIADNATALKKLLALFKTKLTRLDTAFNALSANEQQSIAEKRLQAYLSADLTDLAQAQIDSSVTLPANKLILLRMLGSHIALQDHFPQTDVASVDTDNDGKPNFFAPNATEEQISASQLTADDDADNDSVLDKDDKAPLDSTKY